MVRQPTDSEHELVDDASEGSVDALTELFRRHWTEVYRLALGLTGNTSSAEDVAQDAFERAFRRLGQFDRRSSFGTWIHRITVNRAIDHVRARRPTVDIDMAADLVSPNGAVDPDPGLRAAVAQLPLDRRTVVVLRYWFDYAPSTIATLLDLPVGTVNSRLARALNDLREQIEVPG